MATWFPCTNCQSTAVVDEGEFGTPGWRVLPCRLCGHDDQEYLRQILEELRQEAQVREAAETEQRRETSRKNWEKAQYEAHWQKREEENQKSYWMAVTVAVILGALLLVWAMRDNPDRCAEFADGSQEIQECYED